MPYAAAFLNNQLTGPSGIAAPAGQALQCRGQTPACMQPQLAIATELQLHDQCAWKPCDRSGADVVHGCAVLR